MGRQLSKVCFFLTFSQSTVVLSVNVRVRMYRDSEEKIDGYLSNTLERYIHKKQYKWKGIFVLNLNLLVLKNNRNKYL